MTVAPSMLAPPIAQARVLVSRRDVTTAAPGLYVTQSGTDAYFVLRSLVESGFAKLEGEQWTARGKIITVTVLSYREKTRTTGALAEPPEQPIKRTVPIDQSYFINNVLEYNEWPLKWWREVVQNAVDAGATKIDLVSTRNPDGTITNSCTDNGSGMDRDTLLDKFLTGGATGKPAGSGFAGGFGKAKDLILFAWIQWEIETRNTYVVGHGREHEITTLNPPRAGTLVRVIMPADMKTDENYAHSFMAKCDIDAQVTINGQTWDPGRTITIGGQVYTGERLSVRRRKPVQEAPDKFLLYFIPYKGGDTSSELFIRVKGLYMFTRYIASMKGQLIIELTGPSTHLLTANRDGFQRGIGYEIDQLINAVAADKEIALTRKKHSFTQIFRGEGMFRASRRTATLLERIGPTESGVLPGTMIGEIITIMGDLAREESAQAQREHQEQGPTGDMTSPEAAQAMLEGIKIQGPTHVEHVVQLLAWTPDFIVNNSIDEYKIAKKFMPETMAPTIRKLAKTWAELCKFVLGQLNFFEPYGVGFDFSETAAASHTIREGNHWFMLNPFNDVRSRTEIWRPTDDADLKWLYAAAIHEATHGVNGLSDHNVDFAYALTSNMAKCADGYRKVRTIVRAVKMRGQADLEAEPGEEPKRRSRAKPKLSPPKSVMDLPEPVRELFKRIAINDFEGIKETYIKSYEEDSAEVLRDIGWIEKVGGDSVYDKLTDLGRDERPYYWIGG